MAYLILRDPYVNKGTHPDEIKEVMLYEANELINFPLERLKEGDYHVNLTTQLVFKWYRNNPDSPFHWHGVSDWANEELLDIYDKLSNIPDEDPKSVEMKLETFKEKLKEYKPEPIYPGLTKDWQTMMDMAIGANVKHFPLSETEAFNK